MREIKFRAWDRHRKEMVKIFLMAFPGKNSKHFYVNGLINDNSENFELMQYTGLKDKNGVEIYEGDIVKYQTVYEWDKNPVKIQEVVFESGMFTSEGVIMDLTRSEVIGNIYDNPELIKGE